MLAGSDRIASRTRGWLNTRALWPCWLLQARSTWKTAGKAKNRSAMVSAAEALSRRWVRSL